ncbi:MAG TPA: hypothetical protein VIL09_10045 [Microvirga sp.]|jgi:hypothetical protein
MNGQLTARRLAPSERANAFRIVVHLRAHLGEAEFISRAGRQSYFSYELVGAFDDGRIVGVLGMRPVHTLARGSHLHVDDLVTGEAARNRRRPCLDDLCRSGRAPGA